VIKTLYPKPAEQRTEPVPQEGLQRVLKMPHRKARGINAQFYEREYFLRKQSESVSEEPEQDVQMLAVWGSPAAEKTTVSVRLAKYLADRKRNVVLLLCDMTAPMLPCICPPHELGVRAIPRKHPAAAHITDMLISKTALPIKTEPPHYDRHAQGRECIHLPAVYPGAGGRAHRSSEGHARTSSLTAAAYRP
jgi:hypothetical protein